MPRRFAEPDLDAAPAGLRRCAWFGAWLVMGAIWSLSLVAIVSIGVFILPVAMLATVLLARRRSWLPGLPGLIAGLGAPLLYVSYLNRAGPGDICATFARATNCSQELDPLPWLAVGLALVVGGVVVFLIRTRSKPRV